MIYASSLNGVVTERRDNDIGVTCGSGEEIPGGAGLKAESNSSSVTGI